MLFKNEVKVMSKQKKTFSGLTAKEFQQVLINSVSPDFHDLTAEDFFTALAAIDQEEPHETMELRATVKDGQLIFLEPAPLHVLGNEIRWGDKRVVINLVLEEVGRVGE